MCSKDLCSERSREGSSIVLDSSGRMPTQLGKAITNQPSLPLPKPGSHPPVPRPSSRPQQVLQPTVQQAAPRCRRPLGSCSVSREGLWMWPLC